jgi:3-oxoacyl-[acyl-carrier-protein] synthase III
VLSSKGDVDHLLYIKAGGSAYPASAETVAANEHVIRMRGNDVFKLAVRCMCQATQQALDRAGLTLDDIHTVIPHQANLRIIQATQEALGLPLEKVFVNVDRHGNTGAASVPIALVEYLDTNTVCPGDNLLMVSFGGGLTWAATIVRWGDIERLRNERQ